MVTVGTINTKEGLFKFGLVANLKQGAFLDGYQDARVITKPDESWLNPGEIK